MKKIYKVLALILSCTIILGGCSSKKEPVNAQTEEIKSTAVEVLNIKKSSIENQYTYSGKVIPVNEVNALSIIGGKVKSVNYDVGDSVKAGSVLFTMDTSDIVNNINVLKASLGSAEANINSAKTGIELVNGANMQSQIESAKAGLSNAELAIKNAELVLNNADLALNNAKTAYENNKVLFETNIVSKTAFEQSELAYNQAQNAYTQAQNAYSQAQNAYNQAQENYDIVVNQMPKENLKRAEDSLKVAEASKQSILAQISSAEKSLNDAVVKSPISGVVTACNIKAGTVLAQGGSSPFTIIDTSKININVSVSEQVINSLSVGQEVDVIVSSVDKNIIKGKIAIINPAANSTGTFDVKIEIDNAEGKLKSGMFGQVYFTNEKSQDTIVIPRNCVLTKDEENYVFIEENGIARKVVVTMGVESESDVEILTGLEENMWVINRGQTYINDGDKVQIGTELKGE